MRTWTACSEIAGRRDNHFGSPMDHRNHNRSSMNERERGKEEPLQFLAHLFFYCCCQVSYYVSWQRQHHYHRQPLSALPCRTEELKGHFVRRMLTRVAITGVKKKMTRWTSFFCMSQLHRLGELPFTLSTLGNHTWRSKELNFYYWLPMYFTSFQAYVFVRFSSNLL